ncbi:MAG TPA: hypothetical protein VD866_30935 [Urbifossiella sp.]|nr:hypothetical protein [Urbifossiella sp.]
MSDARPLPAAAPELAEWLGARVAAYDLFETVTAMRNGRPAPPTPAPLVEEVLGADVAPLLADSFHALPEARLLELRTQLTQHPDLLFGLQELIFVRGGPAWNDRLALPAGDAPAALAAVSDKVVDRVMARITAPPGRRVGAAVAASEPPMAEVSPAGPAAPPRRRTRARVLATAGVCLGCAVLGAVGVGVAYDRTLTAERAAASARLQKLELAFDGERGVAAADRTVQAKKWAELDRDRVAEIVRLKDNAKGWSKKDQDQVAEIGRLKDDAKGWEKKYQDREVTVNRLEDDAKGWAARDRVRQAEVSLWTEAAKGWAKQDKDRVAEITRLNDKLAAVPPKAGYHEPTTGTINLQAGFVPDPHKVSMYAGGTIETKEGGVTAWITKAPDYRLNYKAGRETLTIRFEPKERGDTTLHVRFTPEGTVGTGGDWVAAKSIGSDRNPQVRFTTPMSGQYDIWAGTVEKLSVNGMLIITELR